jgi:hypothetical protein
VRLTDIAELRFEGRPVAVARILLSFALAICAVEAAAVLWGIAEGRLQYPVAPLLPAPTVLAVQIYLVLGLLAAACLAFGLFAGPAAATGSLLLFWTLLWDQQTYSSHLLLCALLLGYLAFARSGQHWGLDARRSRDASGARWWPQLLMMSQVSVCYLFAGLSKINPRFLSGEPLQGWMRIDEPLWVFQVLSVATVVVEIGMAIGLWIPRARILAVVAGLGLHAGIVIGLDGQNVVLLGFAATCIATYWMFLSRPTLGTRDVVPAVRARPEQPQAVRSGAA